MTTIELTEAGDVKREIIAAPHVRMYEGTLSAKFPYFTPDKGAHIVHLQMSKDEALLFAARIVNTVALEG